MRKLKGQLLSVDLLIGILAAVAVFSIGVTYFDSIASRNIHTNSVIAASNLILKGQEIANSCYTQSSFAGAVYINTCAGFDLNSCKSVFLAKRFTTINITQNSCLEGCILEVKTCEG